MTEYFANHYQTTLTLGIAANATTVSVASQVGSPDDFPFRAIITADGEAPEIVRVTAAGSGTWTVERAIEPVAGVQQATPHAYGATFTAILTAGAMSTLGAGLLADPGIAWVAETVYEDGERISVTGTEGVWVYEVVIAGTSGLSFAWID